MKIALCYYGNLGWKIGSDNQRKVLPPSECHESIKKNIINPNKHVDIFVHSWSTVHDAEIIKTLNPKSYLIENQIEFPEALHHKPRYDNLADIKSFFIKKYKQKAKNNSQLGINLKETQMSMQNLYSRFYSSKKSLELKRLYEEENGFKYDFVMLLRFDVQFYTEINFYSYNYNFFYAADSSDTYRLTHNYLVNKGDNAYPNIYLGFINKSIVRNFREKLGLKKSIFWVQPDFSAAILCMLGLQRYSLSDTWFFSGSENMDLFGKLYDDLRLYRPCPHMASYQHICKAIGAKKLMFTLEQFKDFDVMRQSRSCIVPYPTLSNLTSFTRGP
jgi:hypothetical protein